MKKKQKINKAVNAGEKVLLGLTALFLCALFFLSRRPAPQRVVTVRTSSNRAPAALSDGSGADGNAFDSGAEASNDGVSDGASGVSGGAETSGNDSGANADASDNAPNVPAAPVDPDGRVNINVADVATLRGLPGIGEALAGRIVEYRETFGPFRTTADVMNVSGIGEGKYKAIAALIVV